MSCRKAISLLTPDAIRTIEAECTVQEIATEYNKNPPITRLYYKASSNPNVLILPFFFAQSLFNKWPNSRRIHPPIVNAEMQRAPKDEEQANLIRKANLVLDKYHSVVLALRTGFGKTYCSLKLGYDRGLKTGILVHLAAGKSSFIKELKASMPQNKVQIVSTTIGWNPKLKKMMSAKDEGVTSPLDPNADIYIIGPTICVKMGELYEDPFSSIGTVIVDECHSICTEKRSMALTQFVPKYLIGLSATPRKDNGLDRILDIYFGPIHLCKKLNTPFTVVRYLTHIVPKKETNRQGRLDWNKVLESLALNEQRNKLIVDIVSGPLKEKNVMVMCRLTEQCVILYDMMVKRNISVTKYWGNAKTFDEDARVIIGTDKKCGESFDHPKLNSFVVTFSMKKITQKAGRIFRKAHETAPIIWDLVDEMFTLNKHFKQRADWYKESGATIDYNNSWTPAEEL